MENFKVASFASRRSQVTAQHARTDMPVVSFAGPSKPKLLEQVRQAIRTRHYSDRTEKAHVHWIKRFIFFHNKRHPIEMAETEVGSLLSTLATEAHVSASTQNQAFNALLFLYHEGSTKRSD